MGLGGLSCDISVKSLASFCPYPKRNEVQRKDYVLVCLAEDRRVSKLQVLGREYVDSRML